MFSCFLDLGTSLQMSSFNQVWVYEAGTIIRFKIKLSLQCLAFIFSPLFKNMFERVTGYWSTETKGFWGEFHKMLLRNLTSKMVK